MYFTIKNSLDKKLVGSSYPQVDCLTMFQAQALQSWKFPNQDPKLEFALKPKAILTDALSDVTINARGFLVSEKLKTLLEGFKLMEHKFYTVFVKTRLEDLQYYWLHLSDPEITRTLDFQNSKFYRTEYTFREEPIELKSLEDYHERKRQDKNASFGVELDKIVLSNSFDEQLDLFTFLPLDNHVYISERLKEAIDKNDITGFHIENMIHPGVCKAR